MWNDYNSNKQKGQVFIKHARKSSNAVFKKPSRLKLKAKTFQVSKELISKHQPHTKGSEGQKTEEAASKEFKIEMTRQMVPKISRSRELSSLNIK